MSEKIKMTRDFQIGISRFIRREALVVLRRDIHTFRHIHTRTHIQTHMQTRARAKLFQLLRESARV